MYSILKIIKSKSDIKCPECYTWLIPFRCHDVVIDKCDNCQGIWFDAKELGVFRRSLQSFELEEVTVDIANIENDSLAIGTCPRCKIFLDESNFGYNTQIKLQKCRNCEGIWLRESEVVKFVSMARTSQILGPDLKVVAEEMSKAHRQKTIWNRVRKIMDLLSKKIPFWFR